MKPILSPVILITCLAFLSAGLNAQTPPSHPATPPAPVAAAAPEKASAAPSNTNVDYLKSFAEATATSMKMAQQHNTNDTFLGALALLVGILVPLGLFAMIAIIVWLFVATKERQRKLTHETIRLMIEKGQPVPPELFLDRKIAKPRNDLRRGVVLISIGVGCVLMFFVHHQHGIWGLGVIPLLMGIGYIIVWKIQGGEKNNGNPSQSK